MKSAVLVFPGINRERDMARALKLASGQEAAMVWHAETALKNVAEKLLANTVIENYRIEVTG